MLKNYDQIIEENPDIARALSDLDIKAFTLYNSAILDRNLAKEKYDLAVKILQKEKSNLIKIIQSQANPALKQKGLPQVNTDKEEDLTAFSTGVTSFYFRNRTR